MGNQENNWDLSAGILIAVTHCEMFSIKTKNALECNGQNENSLH